MDNDLIANLSPEELQQLMGMTTLDERGGVIQDQIAQALAMRQPVSGQHSTGMGAALGGLGDVLGNIGGGIQNKMLRGEQQGNLAKKDAGNSLYGSVWQRMLRSQEPTPNLVSNSPLEGQQDQPFSWQAASAPFGFGRR